MKRTHYMSSTSEYAAWINMKTRCYNPKDRMYHRYGGRGIIVCDSWRNSFLNFYLDMGNKPFPKAELDREDNDGNYEPDNCRWVTHKNNTRNTSKTKLNMKKAGEIRLLYGQYSFKELAIIYNVSQGVINGIVRNQTWKI